MDSNGKYFIAKCDSMKHMRTAMQSSVWACNDRQLDPQPRVILSQAFDQGPVVLIFSVSNCKGWHGYAVMVNKPGDVVPPESHTDSNDNDKELSCRKCHKAREPPRATVHPTDMHKSFVNSWYYFKMQWKLLFLHEFGEECLPFSATASLTCCDNITVNKARNLQEIPTESGEALIELMTEYYTQLKLKQEAKTKAKLDKLPPLFLGTCTTRRSVDTIWQEVICKVEEIGKVLIACPFGSQRYNLATAGSDIDVFIVYAADTSKLLGFTPPPNTIKNRDTEEQDYTIIEIHRFCELCLGGDPRCVETLFLPQDVIHCQSPEWLGLLPLRHHLLTRKCLDKYLRDACGGKGMRLLEKLVASGEALQSPMPLRVAKLCYIILRLLYNARDIAEGRELQVYREEGSPEKTLLVEVRQGLHTFSHLRPIIDSLLKEIENHQGNHEATDDNSAPRQAMEKWLLQLRYASFKSSMEAIGAT